MSLKNRIKNYLAEWHSIEPQRWIHGGEIEKLAMEAGYKPTHASRRCRDLVKEGKIEKKYNSNRHVIYRYNPQGDPFAIIMQETNKRAYETNK